MADGGFIQKHIDRKNPKPANYQCRYAAKWLVLVHHGHQPSSGFDVPADLSGMSFRRDFDRVFILSMLGGAVTAFALQPMSSGPAAT